jgi:hypothetical protein
MSEEGGVKRTAMNEYDPDYAVPPRETFTDWVLERELDRIKAETGRDLYPFVFGDRAVDDELAGALAEVTGIKAAFWIKRQEQYAEILTRREAGLGGG